MTLSTNTTTTTTTKESLFLAWFFFYDSLNVVTDATRPDHYPPTLISKWIGGFLFFCLFLSLFFSFSFLLFSPLFFSFLVSYRYPLGWLVDELWNVDGRRYISGRDRHHLTFRPSVAVSLVFNYHSIEWEPLFYRCVFVCFFFLFLSCSTVCIFIITVFYHFSMDLVSRFCHSFLEIFNLLSCCLFFSDGLHSFGDSICPLATWKCTVPLFSYSLFSLPKWFLIEITLDWKDITNYKTFIIKTSKLWALPKKKTNKQKNLIENRSIFSFVYPISTERFFWSGNSWHVVKVTTAGYPVMSFAI